MQVEKNYMRLFFFLSMAKPVNRGDFPGSRNRAEVPRSACDRRCPSAEPHGRRCSAGPLFAGTNSPACNTHIIPSKWRQAPDTAAVQSSCRSCVSVSSSILCTQGTRSGTPTAHAGTRERGRNCTKGLEFAASEPLHEKTKPLSPLPPSPVHISHPKGKLHYINLPVHCIFNKSHSH